MRTSRYIVVAVIVLLASIQLYAQVNDTYVIPVSANVPGDRGTVWATELNVFNPQSYPLNVSAVFLPTLSGQSLEVNFKVEANSNAFTPNVLPDLFGRTGTGALLLAVFPEDNPGVSNDILSRSILVNSKTFNNSSTGTYGQFVPGIWTGLLDFEVDQISAIAHGVRNSAASGYRTNVGAANLGRTTAILRVTVYDAVGRKVADRTPFTLPFYAHLQQPLPVNVDRGSVEFFLDDPSGEAVVFPYVSIIDNRSGDAIYISPILLASPSVLYKYGTASQDPGKKIDIGLARKVAAQAKKLGEARLLVDEDGNYRLRRNGPKLGR